MAHADALKVFAVGDLHPAVLALFREVNPGPAGRVLCRILTGRKASLVPGPG